jgi:hypothetical protein
MFRRQISSVLLSSAFDGQALLLSSGDDYYLIREMYWLA